MIKYRTIKPTDILFLRGNRLFGGAGEHGEAEMPPWPSVFSGAMASRILADKGKVKDITAHPDRAESILANTAGKDFGCTFLGLIKMGKGEKGETTRVFLPLPGDLVAVDKNKGNDCSLYSLVPKDMPHDLGLESSGRLPMVPVLQSQERAKPVGGLWMDLEGWRSHLSNTLPDPSCLVPSSELWALDHRLGIAMDTGSRTAAHGRIYTSEAVSLAHNTAFLAGFSGENIPETGLLRLGGDGRGAELGRVSNDIVESLEEMGRPQEGWDRFRIVLITPGIFPNGWLPPGCKKDGEGRFIFEYDGLKAELCAVSAGRSRVVSGWDMANHMPKPACKVVPQGSVYWFRVIDGDTGALEPLWHKGLYEAEPNMVLEYSVARRREGFSRVWFGTW